MELGVLGRNLARPLRVLIALAILLSFPVTFALDRANTDFLLALLLVVGASALEQRRHFLSATMFALAGAAKILPILYFSMFVRRRRLLALVFGLLLAGVLTVAAFTTFAPLGTIPTQIKELRTSLMFQSDAYQHPGVSTPFNASVTGFVQAIGYAVNGVAGAQSVAPTAEHYVGLEELLGAILAVLYVVIIERRTWRALTLLTVASLLLPEYSGYYSLTFLLAPLALFVGDAAPSRRTVAIAVIYGLIFAPKAYAFFGVGAPLVDSSVLVTAPLLIALGSLVVFDGIQERGGVTGLIDSAWTFGSHLRLLPATNPAVGVQFEDPAQFESLDSKAQERPWRGLRFARPNRANHSRVQEGLRVSPKFARQRRRHSRDARGEKLPP